jgi:hypothetical protein
VNPLLKVPPASRGNRTRARFPSRSGGNLKEGEKTEPNPHSVPLAKRGEPQGGGQRPNPYPARFPSRSGGTEPSVVRLILTLRGWWRCASRGAGTRSVLG